MSPTNLAPSSAAATEESAPADVDLLCSDIRRRRAEFTQLRYIAQDVIDRFAAIGVYRALVPKRFGGDEKSASEFCELVETIAQADGSAGWVASFGMAVTYLASLPPKTFAQIYSKSPDVIFAGGIFPPQRAPRVDGGYEVSGRWSFASGCMSAQLFGVGIAPADGDKSGLPRMAVIPRDKARIDMTWDVSGMVGTGSHDLVVDRVVVPEDWTFVRGAPSQRDEPMFRYPTLSFAAQVLSVVGLGIARGAIEELRAMAAGRVSVTGAPRLADRPQVQLELGRAEAQLRAVRAFFYDAIGQAWDALVKGDELTPEQVSMLRLSSTHAARTAAEVTRTVQLLTGMTGVYESSPISQQVRDSQVLTQHAFMGDITYQNAGAMLFGQSPLPGYL